MKEAGEGLLFDYPRQARFGQVVPKQKIYDHAGANAALKERFVQQVQEISWAYKLAPETINLLSTHTVTEIQIFRITLKGVRLDQDVLRAIDRAIPFPLIFELVQGEHIKLAAAYKRPAQNLKGEADSSRWVVGNYFETDWQPEDTPRQPLPVALDMAGLYEQLLSPLVQGEFAAATAGAQKTVTQIRRSASTACTVTATGAQLEPMTLEQRIALTEAVAAQQKAIERIKARLGREEQFNKRVAINVELRDAKQELQRLLQQQAAAPSY